MYKLKVLIKGKWVDLKDLDPDLGIDYGMLFLQELEERFPNMQFRIETWNE